MHTPSRIAILAAIALSAAMFIASLVITAAWTGTSAAYNAIAAILLGILAWPGTYIGARMAGRRSCTSQLTRALVTAYGLIGVIVALPMRTHAVVVNVPTAGSLKLLTGALAPFAAALLVVLVAFAITAGIATVCRAENARDT